MKLRGAFPILVTIGGLGLASCDSSRESHDSTPAAAAGSTAQSPAADAALRLGLDELRREMADQGRIVRERSLPAGTGALPDPVLASRVRARILEDPELPAMAIAVAAGEGKVTLSGRVGSIEGLQRALRAALSVPEARAVIAELSTAPDDGSGLTKGSAEEPSGPPGK